MKLTYGSNDKSALQAKYDAQKIAFGPIMFQAAKALRDLGILELVKSKRKQGITKEAIADELNLSVYGVKVLLEAGLSLELVKVEDGLFKITKTGWHILSDELTRVNMDFTHDVNYLGMFSLEESIKTGKPTGLKVLGNWDTVYEGLSQLPEKAQKSWFAFDHFYSDYAFPEVLPKVLTPSVKKVLDVGGNTGKFSIKCAGFKSDVEVQILDLPGQLNKAFENIKLHGFEDRISGVPLDLLDHSVPFPKGADVIWMSQFLDCFSQKDVLQLLLRAKNALDGDAALFIMETYWDKQKFEASTYSLHATSLYFTNIANGCSQMYHSQDMLNLIDKAGLYVDESFEDVGVSHTLYKCKVRK
ncbi:MAG: methyltransferase [Breznakibacter sp.]